jgi:FMN phosphatase YigB (HAD superfamily)
MSRDGPQRSFDIFDTLIARRCIWPAAVFDEIERRSGHAGFAAARRRAEQALGDQEYTLADIHAVLAPALQLGADQAQALLALEIEVELDAVIPVADAIALVEADSLLITDMYLPEAVIRRLLQRAGLPGHITLLRSAHGKRSGKVWAALAQAGLQLLHLGDNPRADIEQARAAGMQAVLTMKTQPTPTEAALLSAGLPLLAQVLREARLATARGGLGDELLRLQTELNLPVLAASALHLLATAGDLPQLRLLFSARDARYLQAIYDALASGLPGGHPSSHYWHSSRLARTGGDAGYLAYCRELIGPAAWLVDLCGTGASVLALRERLGIAPERAQLFVCEYIDSPAQISDLMQRYGLKAWQTPAALWTDRTLVPNEVLELLNYVPEGMVRGVTAVPGGFVPLREPMEFAPEVLAGVRAQQDFVQAYAGHLARAARVAGAPLLREFAERGPQACAAIGSAAQGLMPEISALVAAWLPGHRLAERELAARLGAPALN